MANDVTPVAPVRSSAADIALVATGAALVAVSSLVAIPVGPVGVPITLQTFGVLLAGAVLGARRGALAVLLYLAVGFAGLPVFSEGNGGIAALARPTVGYLLAFALAAWVTGVIVERGRKPGPVPVPRFILATLAATVAIYAIGIPVLALRVGITMREAIVANVAYLPFDAVKLIAVVVVASAVNRAYPDLLRRAPRT